MTSKQNYPMYALASVAGVGVALWAGMPLTFLLLLFCPVVMFFMMRGMGGMSGGQRSDDATRENHVAAKRSTPSASDGSHERIE